MEVQEELSVCQACPFYKQCRPELVATSESRVRRMVQLVRDAPKVAHKGFGRPVPELSSNRILDTGINCNEYARAMVTAARINGEDAGYLLWVEPHMSTHLTPVAVSPKKVMESGTEEYWKLGFTPVLFSRINPYGLQMTKLTRQQAKTLPVLPPDESLTRVAELGYGEITGDRPRYLDTGVALVFRVRVYGVTGWLVWFKGADPVVISKDPNRFVAHAHRTMHARYSADTFRRA